MRVNGSFVLAAPAERVRAVLADPAVLAGAIPGCERFEAGDDSARLTVAATVAATTAAYTVDATTTGQRPDSLTVEFAARGEPGSLTGTVVLRLSGDADGTELTCEIEAEAAGQLAAVGGALLAATVKRLAARFFEALAGALTREPEPAAPMGAGRATGLGSGSSAESGVGATPEPAAAHSRASTQPPPVAAAQPPAATAAAHVPAAASRIGDLASAGARASRVLGRGFGAGVLVGAVVGAVAGAVAAKLASLLARRNR